MCVSVCVSSAESVCEIDAVSPWVSMCVSPPVISGTASFSRKTIVTVWMCIDIDATTRAVTTPARSIVMRLGAAPPTAAVSVEPIWSETGPGMIAHAAMRRACTKKGAISCISVPISPSIRITLIGSTITLMMPLSSVSTKPSCATTLTSASLALVPTASRMSCRLPARQISCSKRCASAACDDAPAPVSRKAAAGGARSPAEELSSVLRLRLGSGMCSTVSSYASAAAAAAAVAATAASICVAPTSEHSLSSGGFGFSWGGCRSDYFHSQTDLYPLPFRFPFAFGSARLSRAASTPLTVPPECSAPRAKPLFFSQHGSALSCAGLISGACVMYEKAAQPAVFRHHS